MIEWTTTRRQLLWHAGAAGTLTALAHCWPGWSGAASKGKIFVRRDILSLAPDGPEIEAFRHGVAVMKKRPASDPTSWAFQGNIHAARGPAKPGWNQCQHGNYFFLPWHRMYAYWFERILRAASGDANFTLPYWNYINPTARALPLVLRQPANATNPLYVAERNTDAGGVNNGAALPASAAATCWSAMRLEHFCTAVPTCPAFGGRVVGKPGHDLSTPGSLESYHNLVHVLIGGEKGHMSDPTRAARDPVFWLHHANVDRLWKRWLDQGGQRGNPLGDRTWMNTVFPFFDEKGRPVKTSVREALDSENQLGYRYDDDPPAVACRPARVPVPLAPDKPPKALAASKGGPVSLGSDGPVRVTIDLGEVAIRRVAGGESRLFLLVEGIHFEAEPMIYYEVYLNQPAERAPDFQSIHYAGNLVFALVGLPGGHDHHGHEKDEKKLAEARYLAGVRAFDVTDLVRELCARKSWPEDRLTVTFVLGGLVPVKKAAVTRPGKKARFEKITLAATL